MDRNQARSRSSLRYFRIVSASLVLGGAALLAGCSTAEITTQNSLATSPPARPSVIYVSDFQVPLDRLKEEVPANDDRVKTASELVDLMAETLVRQLNDAGFKARRLPAGPRTPANAWTLSGAFTRIDEGNRFGRAIGWGLGKTALQANVSVSTVTQGHAVMILTLTTDAHSGSAPALGPISVAVKFARAGSDLPRNVKETATKIVAAVSARVGTPLLAAAP